MTYLFMLKISRNASTTTLKHTLPQHAEDCGTPINRNRPRPGPTFFIGSVVISSGEGDGRE